MDNFNIQPFSVNALNVNELATNWRKWLRSFMYMIEGRGITANERKKALLLHLSGTEVQDIYETLQPLENEENKNSFTITVDRLTAYFTPKANKTYERHLFRKIRQEVNEKVDQFVTRLRSQASKCEFHDTDEEIKSQLIDGCYNHNVRVKILEKGDIDLAEVTNLMRALELTSIQASSYEETTKIHKMGNKKLYKAKYESRAQTGHKKTKENETKEKIKCFRCDREGHMAKDLSCPARNAKCRKCDRIGHFQKCCKTKSVKQINDTGDITRVDPYQMFAVNSKNMNSSPILLKLKLNGHDSIMELDTGAACTIITLDTFMKIKSSDLELAPTNKKLFDFSGNSIKAHGEIEIPVEYQEQRKTLKCVVVDGQNNLFGRDWLKEIKLNWNKIMHMTSKVNDWSVKYPDVFTDNLGKYNGPKISIIKNQDAVPIFLRERQVPYSLKEAIDKELDSLVEKGILIPVQHSKWATPIVPVLKKNNTVRICGDYRLTVNKATKIQNYPLPRLEQLLERLGNCKIFTKIDLAQAFQQMELDEEAQEMCTINTHRGLFKMTRLPFGVSSSAAIFQRTIDTLLSDIPKVATYIDDILVGGKTQEEHDEMLHKVLQRLKNANLTVKEEKCEFQKSEIAFLGHKINKDGIAPMPAKLEAIRDLKEPSNIDELRKFLGLINYYHRFVPNMATVLEPLHKLLRNGETFKWTKEQTEAFMKAKESLMSTKILVHYDPDLPLRLTTDASPFGIAGVLSHVIHGEEKPIGFISRSLNSAERNYSQTEKEALAVVYATTKFHAYLYGKTFEIHSDHKPLSGLFTKATSKMTSGRIARWSLQLSQYEYTLKYKRGKDIPHADSLSRMPVEREPDYAPLPQETFLLIKLLQTTPLNFKEIAKTTKEDKVLQKVLHYSLTRWPEKVSAELEPYYNRRLEISIQESCLLWGSRVIIPETLRNKCLELLHEDHSGVVKMKRTARNIVYWPNIDRDIEAIAKYCQTCQLNSKSLPELEAGVWPIPEKPWSRIHLDFAENFLSTNFLILVDAHSKWIDVFKCKHLSSQSVIKHLSRAFSYFGLPDHIHTDNGSAFTANDFNEFCASNGIRHTTNGAFHPQTNGLAERAVQNFKNAMVKLEGNIENRVNRFLLRYRSTVQESTLMTPAKLLQGRELVTKLDRIRPQPKQKDSLRTTNQEPRELKTNSKVLVRNHLLTGPKWMMGKIIERMGRMKYKIALDSGAIVTRHIDSLKEFFEKENIDQERSEWKPQEEIDRNKGKEIVKENFEVKPKEEKKEVQVENNERPKRQCGQPKRFMLEGN